MRYKGYVVTYTGELLKVNKENYFLNGICREELEQADIYEVNKEFGRRNLYAVSSGAKCDEAGDELSLLVVDIMKGFFGSDFANEYQSYFSMANSAIYSHIFEKTDEHFEVDTSVLYIQNDIATVYNIGDMPVFYFETGKLKKISGDSPQTVEIEKDIQNKKGEVHTQVLKKDNIPYLGFFDEEYENVPYESQNIKLNKNAFFVLCSKAVSDVVGEKNIEAVLADKSIKDKDKAARIMDIAIEKKPDANYTVQVVQADKGIPITETEARSVFAWVAVALFCVAVCFSSSYIVKAITGIVDSSKAFFESLINKEVEPDGDLIWIPKEDSIEQQNEMPQGIKDSGNIENVDNTNDNIAPSVPVVTAPQTDNVTNKQKPVEKPQTPSVKTEAEEQEPSKTEAEEQTPSQTEPVVEVPGTTVPPETHEEVELPIDLN